MAIVLAATGLVPMANLVTEGHYLKWWGPAVRQWIVWAVIITIAALLLARLLPIFFVGPAAGVPADRISRRAIGHLLDRGVDPRALMAACGLVALVPAAFWASVQAAFRRAEPRDTAAA